MVINADINNSSWEKKKKKGENNFLENQCFAIKQRRVEITKPRHVLL